MYPEHYKALSQDTAFAARILHYYLHMGSMAKKPSPEYDALNNNARFWNDFNYMALQTVIIFLGKVFDDDPDSHSISKTINVASKEISHFGKPALRERKVAIGGEFEGLDTYISGAHELSNGDLRFIQKYRKRANQIWKKLKPLRDKIYAHNAIISDKERKELFEKVTYTELQELVQILLNITNALEQAEINGRKPDFDDDYEGPINLANGEVDKLMSVLVKGTT